MLKSDKNGKKLWSSGIVLSFDFSTAKLKDYFSKTSPQGAYEVVKRFLVQNGFEHRKDSDYVNPTISKIKMVDLLIDFANENKWVPLCVNKMNISPNIEALDISDQLRQTANEKWKSQKDKENEGMMTGEAKTEKQGSMSDFQKMINDMKKNNAATSLKKRNEYKKDRER